MKLKFIILGGITLITILIFGLNFFDFSEPVPIIKVKLDILEVDGEFIIIDKFFEQSQTTYLKRPRSELQDFPLISSHAAVNGQFFSEWGILKYNGPGEYEVLMGFREGFYPESNASIMVITYIYDEEGTPVLKDTSYFIWE